MTTQQVQGKKGSLEIICGPMFSGKSEELMRRLRRATIAKQRVITFKPSIDDRYKQHEIASHDGTTLQAKALDIRNAHTILDTVGLDDFTVIGIDEIQFFPPTVISVICSLIDDGRRVIASGLDLDFRGIPFGPLPTLLAIADNVTKLHAICCQCGNDAHLTQRLINGKPANFDDPIVLVGAQQAYQARCRNCFSIDKQPTVF